MIAQGIHTLVVVVVVVGYLGKGAEPQFRETLKLYLQDQSVHDRVAFNYDDHYFRSHTGEY